MILQLFTDVPLLVVCPERNMLLYIGLSHVRLVTRSCGQDWCGLTNRVTHICVSKINIIGSDNGLAPGGCQAVIWNNAGVSLNEPLRANFSEIFIIFINFHSIKCIAFENVVCQTSAILSRPQCVNSLCSMNHEIWTGVCCALCVLVRLSFLEKKLWIWINILLFYCTSTDKSPYHYPSTNEITLNVIDKKHHCDATQNTIACLVSFKGTSHILLVRIGSPTKLERRPNFGPCV